MGISTRCTSIEPPWNLRDGPLQITTSTTKFAAIATCVLHVVDTLTRARENLDEFGIPAVFDQMGGIRVTCLRTPRVRCFPCCDWVGAAQGAGPPLQRQGLLRNRYATTCGRP